MMTTPISIHTESGRHALHLEWLSAGNVVHSLGVAGQESTAMMKSESNVMDAIWLHRGDYRVVPLNRRLSEHTPELERALRLGVPATPDTRRPGFYVIELESGWMYVHIRENAQTVYLVARSSRRYADDPAARLASETCPGRSGYCNV
jgi:hypothetical protein